MVVRDWKRAFAPYLLGQENASVRLKPANYFDARSRKDILLMRRIGKLGGQILPGEVELFMQVGAPFGAIGYIINYSAEGNQFASAAFARAAT